MYYLMKLLKFNHFTGGDYVQNTLFICIVFDVVHFNYSVGRRTDEAWVVACCN